MWGVWESISMPVTYKYKLTSRLCQFVEPICCRSTCSSSTIYFWSNTGEWGEWIRANTIAWAMGYQTSIVTTLATSAKETTRKTQSNYCYLTILSSHSLCQRSIARWAMQEISMLQTWWNGTGSSGTGYCHQAQWVVKDLIENPPCLSLIQDEPMSIERAM